jgi:hypothetical protein
MSNDGDLEAQRVLLQPHRVSYHLARHYPLGWKVLMVKRSRRGRDSRNDNPPV